jgi:hypothetical protein
MKTKTKNVQLLTALGLGLAMAIVICATGCTSGPLSSNLNHAPAGSDTAWRGGNHTQPVYTSPTVAPTTQTLTNAPD